MSGEIVFEFKNENGKFKEITSLKWDPCRDFISTRGLYHLWKDRFFSSLPNRCDKIKPGKRYRIRAVKIPEKRKDWDAATSLLIPYEIPKSKEYKITFQILDNKGQIIGMFELKFQLKQSK